MVGPAVNEVSRIAERMKEKRAVLDGVAAELRRILGQKPAVRPADQKELRLAA